MNKKRPSGKSHSIRPVRSGPPKWVRFTREEVELLVEELAKKGYPPSMIGLVLRDQYGIPLVKQIAGKKIVQILKEKNLSPKIPEDLYNLIRKAANIRRHLFEHPKDKRSKRALEEVESKIRKLARYYIDNKVLPLNWKYEPEKAELLASSSLY